MRNEWLCTADELGQSPLTRIAKSGRMELANVLLLLEVCDDISRVGYLPPMHRAAYWNYDDAIGDLLEEGVDPTQVNDAGETPLHLAVRLGNHEAAVALIRSGMDVTVPDALGMTPLHWAALKGYEGLAKALLAHGADPYALEWVAGGLSPVRMARIMGHEELAGTLQRGIEACFE